MPITRRRRANPPDQPENNHHQPADQPEGTVEQPLNAEPAPTSPAIDPEVSLEMPAEAPAPEASAPAPAEGVQPPLLANNGDHSASEYPPAIEGGRRTARGELFRRPPQVPAPPPQASFVSSAPLQAPTHEITLPLGNLLHLAYNPGYTGSEEARGLLLHRLSEESKAGGRARCWNCGSLAIAYDRWNTRSRSFGDVGIAFCEICGVWSVM
ncbi:MAG TPA: hypothetical protein VGM01_00325 [Ktedonobacteraceae bacterium]|jgi:hypothetical protein